jgi:competence ComEA-like helix-hairpin-helix protein
MPNQAPTMLFRFISMGRFRLSIGILLALGSLLAIGVLGWRQLQDAARSLKPLPQDPAVQVFMNYNPAGTYIEPYRKIQRQGDDLEQVIVAAITSARSTVDVAVQELRLPKIAAALIDRQQAGVKVRIILENTYTRPFSSFTPQEVAKLPAREQDRYQEAVKLIDLNGDNQLSPEEINHRDALVMLQKAEIPLIDDTADGSLGSNLMHHKFVIVDQHQLIVTSANFTTSDIHGDFLSPNSRGNTNNLLQIESPKLAALFTQEFNLMWGDGPGSQLDSQFGTHKPYRSPQTIKVGSGTIEVKFSPDDPSRSWETTTNGLIGDVLKTANQTIDMALFVFSEQRLANILDSDHQRGVQIRALIDPGFAYVYYSEALDMMGIALQQIDKKQPCFLEADNHPWTNPIKTVGVPKLPPGDKLHHKFGLVDRAIVITGSHNWSVSANVGNDETLLVIQNSIVAAHYRQEFERLYQGAFLGIPPAIRRKVEAQHRQCPNLINVTTSGSQEKKAAAGKDSETKVELGTQQKVNLNSANVAEIEALPGVGPKLAQRIVAARQRKPFASLDDLDQVSGVGSKLLERLRDRVTW